jgi:hypothetical protein
MSDQPILMFNVVATLDEALYCLIFRYFGDTKAYLKGAQGIMNGELREWQDDDANLVRAWLEHAWPSDALAPWSAARARARASRYSALELTFLM